MVKPEWGAKRICHNCGAPFYDLNRNPAVCPKCGTEYDPEAILKSRRSRVAAPVEKEADVVVADDEVEVDVEAAEIEEVEVDDEDGVEDDAAEEEEEELIEDASELGKDEDDMAEVIENIADEDER